MKRKGMGAGLGKGYKNILSVYDSHIHSLSAKGVRTQQVPLNMVERHELTELFKQEVKNFRNLSKRVDEDWDFAKYLMPRNVLLKHKKSVQLVIKKGDMTIKSLQQYPRMKSKIKWVQAILIYFKGIVKDIDEQLKQK